MNEFEHKSQIIAQQAKDFSEIKTLFEDLNVEKGILTKKYQNVRSWIIIYLL